MCDSPQAGQICNALRTGTALTVGCGGHSWHVGPCVASVAELTVDGTACECLATGYALRPCQGFAGYGGVATNTCNATAQTMNVECSWDL